MLAIFLLLFFGLIDFGRLAYSYVMAEKAMQRAARIAAVRPAVECKAVTLPMFHERVSDTTNPLGTPCRNGGVCFAEETLECRLNEADTAEGAATAEEIWLAIEGLMPSNAAPANVKITYSFDPNGDLGFLGGPYVPVVTAEIENLPFQFVSPLGGLAELAGATGPSGLGSDITYPPMSVSLPGEDLAQGNPS